MTVTGITRDKVVILRVTAGERKRLERYARILGCSLSEAIRTAVAEQLEARGGMHSPACDSRGFHKR
jgi:hypothetical protein